MLSTASRLIVGAAMAVLTAVVVSAQAPATTTETKSFEVIAVDGNDLVVKLPEGTKQLTVPDDFRFTVDGQPLSVHDMKPGMKGTATVTTKTTLTPVTVTEVRNGRVTQVSGTTIIVLSEKGYRMWTQSEVDKRGIKIFKEGKPAQVSDFHTGDTLSATIVTSHPPKVMTEKQVNAILARAEGGAAAAAPAAEPSAVPSATSTSGAAEAPAAQPKRLPKTASSLPLVGLIGLGSITAAAILGFRRRRASL